jgi:hypothetical protein
MSHAECRKEFPLLFDQLDQNAASWRSRGGIKSRHLQDASTACVDGCARFVIKDGRIFIRLYTLGPQSRVRGVMTLFRTAVEAANAEDKARFEGVDIILNGIDRDGFEAGSGAGWVLTKEAADPPGQYLLREYPACHTSEASLND